jgi:hypothetical protein
MTWGTPVELLSGPHGIDLLVPWRVSCVVLPCGSS